MQDGETLLQAERFRVVRRIWEDAVGTVHSREIIEHPGAVTILPLLDDGRICLIKNQRLAVGETLIELPAGTLGPEENPRLAAERELREEMGYSATNIELLHEFWMSPGILRERMYLFLATGLTAGVQALEADEKIEPLLLSWEAALAMIDSGAIHDAKTMIALLYYDRLRDSRR